MFDYFDRDQETQESKNLDRPQEMTEAEIGRASCRERV